MAVSGLNDFYASGMGMPARGIAAVGVAIRFDSLLLSAAALESNRLLPIVRILRRAQQSRPGRQKQICTNP